MSPSPQQIGGGHFRDLSPDWALDGPATTLTVDARDLAAAWLQYRLARVIWTEIREGRTSLKSVAQIMGGSAENQRKKLSGETWASPSDLVGWALAYAPDLAALQPTTTADLFPPAFEPLTGGFETGKHRLPDLTDATSIDWAARLRTLGAALGEHRNPHSSGTLTSQTLRHFLAQHLIATGVNPSTLKAIEIGSRTIARLEIDISGTTTQMDAVVIMPPGRADTASDDLIVHNALARAANDTRADQTVVVMMLLPGTTSLAQMLPGVSHPYPHRAHDNQPDPSTPLERRRLIGPLTVGESGSSALRDWWASNTLDATVHTLGTVGGARLAAFMINDPAEPSA